MRQNDSDPEDHLIGKGDWKLWLGLALVVSVPYLAIYWFLVR
ncbi:hypothetical protein [Aliihoeflea sp. 40Bstr573]|nr:hypothetical protein [Aliihoeflea sp. 40Bstr573]